MKAKTPVTLKVLAQQLKMSVSTVSKALNDYPTINAYTKQRVKQLAEELHFTPNQSAIHLKIQKSSIIGIILPDLMDHFFTRSILGVELYAAKFGYKVIISQSYDHLEREIYLADALLKSRVDGLIIAISKETQDFKHLDQFENLGIPVVYYTRNPSFNLNCHKVLGNTFQGCYIATELLIKRGHQRIAYMSGPKMNSFTHERFNGYINALKNNSITFDPDLVTYSNFDKESTVNAIRKLFYEGNQENKPTAIVAFKEQILLDAVKYLRTENYPEFNELEYIGFGNMPFIPYLDYPPLASVEENPESIGENAVKLLLSLINHEYDLQDYQKLTIDCKIVLH